MPVQHAGHTAASPVAPLGARVGIAEESSYIEKAIVSLLRNSAFVAALVSTRIFPELVPQDKPLPAISYNRIFGAPEHVLGGVLSNNLTESIFQINCISKTYGQAVQLAKSVSRTLDGFIGTIQSVKIQGILMVDGRDRITLQPGVDVLKRHARELDFRIWYEDR